MALDLPDYEVIREIRIHDEYEGTKNPAVAALCQEILDSEDCRKIVREAVKEGYAIGLAQDLDLDYKDDVLQLLRSSFDEKYYLCNLLMGDLNYKAEVMGIFRQNLPLDEMKTQPADSLGLGLEYNRQCQLESMVQELKRYPLGGSEFIETALQSKLSEQETVV